MAALLATAGSPVVGAEMPSPFVTAKPTAAQQRLADFEGQKITPNVPAVGQGRASGLTAQAGRMLPFSPVGRGIQRNIGEAQMAAGRAAGAYGTPQDAYGAGSQIGNALNRFAADKSQAAADYGRFFAAMSGVPPAPMTHTLGVVRDLMGRFPNAPGLTGLFTKSPIARLAGELEPRAVKIPAKTSAMLDQYGRPAIVTPATTVQRGGVLSIAELQELRSQVGYQLEHPGFGPDQIPRAHLKRLYAALTQDMKAAARARGPDALKALETATTNYGIRMRLIDRLHPLVAGEAKERVFARLNGAAMNSGSADAGLLRAAKSVMTSDEWGDFGATVIARLGDPKAGIARAPGEPEFSVGTFATNWRKLSNGAKDQLFGADAPGSPRAGLEQLYRVMASLQNVEKLANVSHTTEVGAAATIVTEVFANVANGRLPLPELGGLAGAYGVAKLLMSPGFTRWLYRLPEIVKTPGPPQQIRANAMTALAASLATQHQQKPQEARRVAPGTTPGLADRLGLAPATPF